MSGLAAQINSTHFPLTEAAVSESLFADSSFAESPTKAPEAATSSEAEVFFTSNGMLSS
jgi:hypothetical protein